MCKESNKPFRRLLGVSSVGLGFAAACRICMGDPFLPETSGDPVAATTVRSQPLQDWKEDAERVDLYWRESLSAQEYLYALERTGQGRPGTSGFEDDVALGPWTPLGPSGNYENRDANGRMTGIEIRQVGGLDYIYAGAVSGGLWFTTTAGPIWGSLGDELPNPSVRAFAVDPNDPQTIVVGTGDWRRYAGAGIYRTTDFGVSWQSPNYVPITPDAFFRVRYLPTDPNVILAACGTQGNPANGGILRSTDGGINWDFGQMNDGRNVTGRATDLIFHPTTPELQFALIRDGPDGTGLYRSFDGGATWHILAGNGLPTTSNWFARASIAICRDFPQNMAIIAEQGNYIAGVFRSTDVGLSWTDISAGLLSSNGTACDGEGICSTNGAPCDANADCPAGETCLMDGCFGGDQIWHAQAIAFRPDDPNEIYLGAVTLARSIDGGANWEIGDDLNIDIGHADITQLYFSPATGDDVLWLLNDGGIYHVDLTVPETTTWNGTGANGLRCSQIDHMDAELGLTALGLQDNGTLRKYYYDSNWRWVHNCDGHDVELDNFTTWLSRWCGSPVQVFKLLATGDPVNTGLDNANYWGPLFYQRDTRRMYNVGSGAAKSTSVDGTASWTEDFTYDNTDNDKKVFGSEIDPMLFLTFWDSQDLLVAEYIGGAWTNTPVNFGVGGSAPRVDGIYASRERPNECWAGLMSNPGYPKLYHTTDSSWQTWDDITGTLDAVGRVQAVVATPFDPDRIFVGTDLGVFVTLDGGAIWEPFQEGLPIVRCTDLRYLIDATGGQPHRLIVSTFGHGVYERPITGVPIAYVDQSSLSPLEQGEFESPFHMMSDGLATVPSNGTLALRGGYYSVSTPFILSDPLTIRAYDGTATIGP